MAMEKPHGWASLTRMHRNGDATGGGVVAEEAFPSLASGGPKAGGVANRRRAGVSLQAPFVSVASKGLVVACGSRGSEGGLSAEDVVVARLLEQHAWADDVLVRDVVRAVDGDEGMASAQLADMAGLESPGAGERDGVMGDAGRAAGAVECEENDVYLKFRREALRLSRARGKYARGAYNAYMAGDHAHAKQFSREARENFKTAEILHAQAAEEILYSRNADGHVNVWSIDLHGLHATEAVMALQERLAYIEKELSTNPAFLYSQSQRAPGHEQPLPLAASRAVVKNELSVITGVGRHSKGGPSLPLAVKNFLLAHGYFTTSFS
ncbi:hypothetical protein M758_8G151800 [Ceratodon purpureus]|nr:hypothetical protein M758_8G151800 [Ceratodon purpureus]